MSVVTRLRKSTTEVKRCGGNRIHPRGYWVHDTGVKTYFDADADFITDGIMSLHLGDDCSEVQLP